MNATLASAIAGPLSLQDSFELIENSNISETSKPALRSVATAAVRHLLSRAGLPSDKESALKTDVRPYLSILHVAAHDDAKARDNAAPGEAASRASQFVEILTGVRPSSPRFREPCPSPFLPLVASSKGGHAGGSLAHLARLCTLAGHVEGPSSFPPVEQLLAEAEKLARRDTTSPSEYLTARSRKRALDAMSIYRSARQALIEAASPEERPALEVLYAPLATLTGLNRSCHLGTEAEVQALLGSQGLRSDMLTPFEVLRAVSPEIAKDFDAWVAEGRGNDLSPSFREQARAALTRIAGWLVRAGLLEALRAAKGVDDLFAEVVRSKSAKRLNSRVAARMGTQDANQHETVCLLEHALDNEASFAVNRSTVTTPDRAERPSGYKGWVTDALVRDIDCLWTITVDLYKEAAGLDTAQEERWLMIAARHGRIREQIEARRLPEAARENSKNKLLLLRQVTLPQLVCVALPMRRREVRALRSVWMEAREAVAKAGHLDVDDHKAVSDAYAAYFEAAVPFTMLSLAVDDGLRRQQYTHGCLGFDRHFRPTLIFNDEGLPIGLSRLATVWNGGLSDPAHIKGADKDGAVKHREEREVRRGVVDHDILWDIITVWRPRQLVSGGAFTSLTAYDLKADLDSGCFALFPSPSRRLARLHRSRTDVSPLVGEELHYNVRKFLRPQLPAWKKLTSEWRSLWAIHITRLLVATYWGGVREDYKHAMWLTMDTRVTLEKQYIVLDAWVREMSGEDPTSWENPHAYDAVMDRLCRRKEELDPLLLHNLPMPPHVLLMLQTSAPAVRHRVRSARPDQKSRCASGLVMHTVPAVADSDVQAA